MKPEHVSAIVGFVRRLRPADLILPAGAALVSAGLQQLVDRENRQRQRLAALDELVDVHRGALAAAGVELPAELVGDEEHPLDVEAALTTMLARTPTGPDYRIAGNSNPVKRPRRLLFGVGVLALAGVAGVTALARLGLLPTPSPAPAEPENSSNSYQPGEDSSGGVLLCGCGVPLGAAVHVEGCDADEAVIGRGEPPLEVCGWPMCDWSSDATRNELSQRTSAAVHRNRCIYRPAGAVVPE